MQADSARLPARSRKLLVDPAAELLLPVASVWEIAIKTGLGKLHVDGRPG